MAMSVVTAGSGAVRLRAETGGVSAHRPQVRAGQSPFRQAATNEVDQLEATERTNSARSSRRSRILGGDRLAGFPRLEVRQMRRRMKRPKLA